MAPQKTILPRRVRTILRRRLTTARFPAPIRRQAQMLSQLQMSTRIPDLTPIRLRLRRGS
jgi:hypothetical protein